MQLIITETELLHNQMALQYITSDVDGFIILIGMCLFLIMVIEQ